jgi:glycerate kinase
MAAALGVKFYDENHNEFIPVGDTLNKIVLYSTKAAEELLSDVELVAMCDIDNPLYGKNGAAYIFAPQKGADADMVADLDGKLQYIADLSRQQTGRDFYTLKGAGAAGGMGFGVCAFLGGSLRPGVDLILDTVGFENQIEDADFIFTGEGRLDSQSLSGKAVIGIARRAKGKPVIAVVGSVADGWENAYNEGVTAEFTTNLQPVPFEIAAKNAHKNLESTMENIVRLINIIK